MTIITLEHLQKLEMAASLAQRYEAILRKHNYHIALSGSALYGNGSGDKDDFDFHIYPHVDQDGNVPDHPPEDIIKWLPLEIERCTDDGDEYEDDPCVRVFVCRDKQTNDRIDLFFWRIEAW